MSARAWVLRPVRSVPTCSNTLCYCARDRRQSNKQTKEKKKNHVRGQRGSQKNLASQLIPKRQKEKREFLETATNVFLRTFHTMDLLLNK